MSPLLVAVVMSGLPCGVTSEDKPCDSMASVPAGVSCWENGSSGSQIGGLETKWIDPKTCALGSLELTTARGWANASYSIPELPRGATRSEKLQAALTNALLPPPEDPKNPKHAIARLKSELPEGGEELVQLIPGQPWWPGPVIQQENSSRPTKEPFDGSGTCPCSLRFDGSRFAKAREWKVGTQTISMWTYLGRGEHAFAVSDADGKRHRWIHSSPHSGSEPQVHLEGDRWYVVMSDGIAEAFWLLGYDAKTGKSWRVEKDRVFNVNVTDAGVQLRGEGRPFNLSWSALSPKP